MRRDNRRRGLAPVRIGAQRATPIPEEPGTTPDLNCVAVPIHFPLLAVSPLPQSLTPAASAALVPRGRLSPQG